MSTNEQKKIIQGIEVNSWGRPTFLHTSKQIPWQAALKLSTANDTKVIPWALVLHHANLEYIGQVRGMSEFTPILARLEDVKDYEESERVAAKIAAKLTAFIRKGTPDDYVSQDEREINFEAGMIIDDLGPGEDIGIIDSKRPNQNLISFRAGQLKAVAAGIGVSYSTISRDYSGTYSAQRQELVEQWINYGIETDNFVCSIVSPVWSQFVRVADLSGVVPMPRDIDIDTVTDALFIAQQMPWIDPLKEAMGYTALNNAGLASEIESIRKRGMNPWDVIEQMKLYREEMEKSGLTKVDGNVELMSAILEGGSE